MTTSSLAAVPAISLLDDAVVDLVERELGHPCDDPDELEDAVFRLGLAA